CWPARAATAATAAVFRAIGSSTIAWGRRSSALSWASAISKWPRPQMMIDGAKASPDRRTAVSWIIVFSVARAWNCLGAFWVERGHRRVPAPPDMMAGMILMLMKTLVGKRKEGQIQKARNDQQSIG